MTNELDIKITAIKSHRNGISGNHFYSVFFSFTEDGESHDLIAVVTSGHGNCFVVSKYNSELCWRGDNFEPQLKDAISQWVVSKNRNTFFGIRSELDEEDQGKVLSPDMKAYIEKEDKELSDHFLTAKKENNNTNIWYYTGAFMELSYLKEFVGYNNPSKRITTITQPVPNPDELEIH